MLDAIETLCAALAQLGYDAAELADIENALRYVAALLRGWEVRQ